MKRTPKSRAVSCDTILAAAALVALALPSVAQGPPQQSRKLWNGPSAAVGSLDLQGFKDNIETLASFGDRLAGTLSHENAEAWVQRRLERMGYVVEFHEYRYFGARRSLYATKVGTIRPDSMYILSAHLDRLGEGGAADDDGSGCSLVLEAARAFAKPNLETVFSIRFIFWNNEEQGLIGSTRYVEGRRLLQGIQSPPGSGIYPEPTWLGIIQHDMILFDHGLPPGPTQIPGADVDIEYRLGTTFEVESSDLANALLGGNVDYSLQYPAEVGSNMCCTDSFPFRNFTAAVSVWENKRIAEIGNGSNPHWHQPTDVFSTYDDFDFSLGFDALRMTVGTVAELAGTMLVLRPVNMPPVNPR